MATWVSQYEKKEFKIKGKHNIRSDKAMIFTANSPEIALKQSENAKKKGKSWGREDKNESFLCGCCWKKMRETMWMWVNYKEPIWLYS